MVFIKDPVEAQDPAPALTRGLDLLQILEEEGPTSLEFLSQHTGWPKSSIARLLKSLENYGAVTRDTFTKLYSSQLRLIPTSPEETLLRNLCHTELQELSEATSLTAELYAFQDSRIILKEMIEPEQLPLKLTSKVGDSLDLEELSALTLHVLAFALPENDWPQNSLWLWSEGKKRKVTGRRLIEAVEETRHKLVTYDQEFNQYGVRRYAAPIFSNEHGLMAIICVAQTWTPLAHKDIQRLSQTVHQSASHLTDTLTRRGF